MQEIQIINRTINIPPELKENIVVEGDSNSQILTFSINRYFDGVDLTTKTIQVAYQNALGQSQYSDAYLKAIDAENDTFTFDWTLPSGIAIKDGEVQISVEFSETVNGVKTYIWKTKPATFYVEDSFPVFGNAQSPDYTLAKKFVDNNNNLGVSQLNDTDEPILIEGREILVPSLIDVVVEGDNKSQIISFKMDRYFKNVDRSTKVISVAYTNALGQSERSPIYNAVVTEDYIIFGWVIDGKVAAKEGIVNFYIECQGNTDEGFYCWKTKPAQLMISKGLKVTGSIPDPTPSWYQIAEQNIKEDLETAKSYAEQAEESANEANNIKNEVIQLKESIETAEPERQAAEQERREYINSLRPYLDTFIETIGIGVEYGLEVTPTSPPSNFVNVSAGAARISNGQRFVITSTSINPIAGSDGINNRKAIIYLDSSGNVATLLGDVDGSVPATPAGGLLLYEVDVRDGTYSIEASMLTDKRKPTIGLYSPVKNKSFESVGARMNEIEEDAQVLESRVGQTENEINILQNRATVVEEDIDDLQITTSNHTAQLDQHDTELDALKVYAAKLESELAALRTAQAQMSADTRIDLPGTGKVTAVPKNAAVLGVGGTIKGMTLRNLVTNGDFSNGTTGWSAGSAVLSAADNTLTITGRGTSQYCSATQSNICPNITNKKVFIKGRLMVTNPDCLSVHVSLAGSVAERVSKIIIENPMANTWYSFTALLQLTSAIQGESISLVIYHRYANAASSLDKAMQIKDIVAIDLDEHGLQFKSETELAQICPNYISGTQSVLAARIRSTDADGNTVSACYIEPTLLRRNVEGVYDEIDLFTGRLTINLDESGEGIESPIIKDNVITGTLLSSPGGSIICEPVIADAGVYNDGVTILRVDYPIQSLETLCKVNADGTQTPLDVSAATITDAGTKITHPALFNGDIVAFTYFTASSGIIGENVYNYVNANGLTLGADGKYYRVGFAIDINGNISLTKTEVV